jgi:hypothetical protein
MIDGIVAGYFEANAPMIMEWPRRKLKKASSAWKI